MKRPIFQLPGFTSGDMARYLNVNDFCQHGWLPCAALYEREVLLRELTALHEKKPMTGVNSFSTVFCAAGACCFVSHQHVPFGHLHPEDELGSSPPIERHQNEGLHRAVLADVCNRAFAITFATNVTCATTPTSHRPACMGYGQCGLPL